MSRLKIAQYAANLVVQHIVTEQTRSLITNHTKLEEDDLTVGVASNVVGWAVASHFKETTDAAVEKAAAWIESKRNKQSAE